MVRELRLTALGTGNDIRGSDLLVCPTLIALGLGCFSFGYGHGLSPNSLFYHHKIATLVLFSRVALTN